MFSAGTSSPMNDIFGAVRHFDEAVRLDPSDQDTAHVARHNRVLTHWLQWPIYPILRFGPIKVWGAYLVAPGAHRRVRTNRPSCPLRGALSVPRGLQLDGRPTRPLVDVPERALSADRIDALRQAIAAAPENAGLRLLLAEMLSEAGRLEEAADEYGALFDAGQLPDDALVAAGFVAARLGRQGRASAYADRAAAAGIDGVGELRAEIDASLGLDGTLAARPPRA